MRLLAFLCVSLMLSGCATSQPTLVDNLCSIFEQKRKWYGEAARSGMNGAAR